MTYVIYDNNGNILRIVNCSPALIEANADGYNYIEGSASDETHYVSGGQILPKSEMTISPSEPSVYVMADGIDDATFTNIPAGTTAEFTTVNGFTSCSVDDGELSLTFDVAQSVRIEFKHPAHLSTWRMIHAY